MLPVLLGLLGPLLGKVIDTVGEKLGVDMETDNVKEKRLEIELELQRLVVEQQRAMHEADLKQSEVNATEAGHDNVFVSGWRPFIGWTCGIAMSYHFVLQPLIVFIMAGSGHPVEFLPEFDMESLMTILLGMLGLGAMRSYEKVNGVARR